MKITKDSTFHCFFEQSGTFKNEFKKLGYNAIDYDILNDYGQTDVQIDLFTEIEKAYNGEESVFDSINPETDYILAFFPCTYFQSFNVANISGRAKQHKGWNDKQKLVYGMERHKKTAEHFRIISEFAIVALDKKINLVIENPSTAPHYLSTYWSLRANLHDNDRTKRGDKMKKPTQYWFINCLPKHNFLFEPEIIRPHLSIDDVVSSVETRAKERSEITSEYANRFIREFILDGD